MPQCWVGVDGTRTGWVVAIIEGDNCELWHVTTLSELEALKGQNIQSIALDIPIGLAKYAARGGRGCDREARRLLSLAKRNTKGKKGLPLVGSSSIFTPPTRNAMMKFIRGASHAVVSEANRQSVELDARKEEKDTGVGLGLSIQTYHILPKIHEADEFVSASSRSAAQSLSTKVPTIECHPELAFLSLLDTSKSRKDPGEKRLSLDNVKGLWSKKTLEGRRQRIELLCNKGGLNATKLLTLSQAKEGQGISNGKEPIELISQIKRWHIKNLSDDKHSLVKVAADDVLDAIVCAITSRKWSCNQARVVEEEGERCCDNHGLPMVIWV